MLIRVAILFGLMVISPWALAGYSLSPFESYKTGAWADAVAIGDVNGDGRNDVVLTTTSYFDETNDYKVFIYIQNPDGTLAAPVKASYGAGANESGLVLADLDRDGRKEIIVGHGAGITIVKWGPFRDAPVSTRLYPAISPQSANDVVVVDVNRDGNLDVISQSWSYGATIYFGDGKGLITRQVELATPAQGYNDMKSGDFNGDGYQDIVVLSGQGKTHAYLYYNDGSDDFSPPLEIDPNPGNYVTIGTLGAGDFNSDGREDLVVMHDRISLALYNQTAAGGLQSPSYLTSGLDPNAMATYDLDKDGRKDLIVQHGGGQLGIYLQGSNSLSPEVTVSGPYATWFNTQGLAAGDINGDACPDIVVANYNYGLVVFSGRGCNDVADLAASLGLTSDRIAVRLDNFGTAAAESPEVSVVLAVTSGSITPRDLPMGCAVASQAPLRTEVLCSEATLPAHTSRTLLLPFTVSGASSRNLLTVTATAWSATPETELGNNMAQKTLRGSLVTPVQYQSSATRNPSRPRPNANR